MLLIVPILKISAQDKSYNITFKVKGIKNEAALLAYHYGDKKYVKDSVLFDANGIGTIKGIKNYEPGIYLLAFPSRGNAYFEFVMKETQYTMETDTVNFLEKMVVKNSEENKLFYDDIHFMNKQGRLIDSLNKVSQNDELSDDVREKAEESAKKIAENLKSKRRQLIKDHPNLLYAKILSVMADVEIPKAPVNEKGEEDKYFAYQYLKNHFFDGFDFGDSGLIRTPVLLPKVFRFMDELSHPAPDSLIVACDYVIEKSKVNEGMFQVILTELLSKYAKSNIMGQEALYVHLIDKYYSTGQAPWTDAETLTKMQERAAALRPTLIGQKAPDLNAYDLAGNVTNLHKFVAAHDFTVLVFWSSECGHCQKEMPELRRIWQDSLQTQKVGIFSISTEIELEHVSKFVTEKELSPNVNWINSYDPTGRQPFRKQYDLLSTPLVVLIYKDKTILAKKIPIKDLPSFIDNYNLYLKLKSSSEK